MKPFRGIAASVARAFRRDPALFGNIVASIVFFAFVLATTWTLAWAFISVGPWSVVALTCTTILSVAIVRRDEAKRGAE